MDLYNHIQKEFKSKLYELAANIAEDLLNFIIKEFQNKISEIQDDQEKSMERRRIESELFKRFNIKEWKPDMPQEYKNQAIKQLIPYIIFRTPIIVTAEGPKSMITPNPDHVELINMLNENYEIINEEKLNKKIKELIKIYMK